MIKIAILISSMIFCSDNDFGKRNYLLHNLFSYFQDLVNNSERNIFRKYYWKHKIVVKF